MLVINQTFWVAPIAQASDQVGVAAGAIGTIVLLIQLAIALVTLAGVWKTFNKAGKPGWGAIIPIYNVVLLLEIAGRPIWWSLVIHTPG